MSSIKLIVGLGNPGRQYEFTRHNIGAKWVAALAARFDIRFTTETKFQGRLGHGSVLDSRIRLLLPSTYMNSSGDSVALVARYFQYAAEEILVVHDELAFDVGIVRLKRGGGSKDFVRMRLGIGHPGEASEVFHYVLKEPSAGDAAEIERAIDEGSQVFDAVVEGRFEEAMLRLHTRPDASNATNQKE